MLDYKRLFIIFIISLSNSNDLSEIYLKTVLIRLYFSPLYLFQIASISNERTHHFYFTFFRLFLENIEDELNKNEGQGLMLLMF